MTTQETYTIGDAAKKVKVETHVLRYWEEELGLDISRNDLGHRFYTDTDVELLDHVKRWKDQGLQLKAIRLMLSENGKLSVPQDVVREAQAMVEKAAEEVSARKEKSGDTQAAAASESRDGKADPEEMATEKSVAAGEIADNREAPGAQLAACDDTASVENILLDERSSKAAKLQFLLENLVSRAVRENNEAILKELDYQFRQFEENAQAREQKHWEREEEHYKKLDELLCQRGRRKDKRKKYPKAKF